MKTEIMSLFKSSEGSYRINNVSTLYRWTTDAIGNNVDRITLRFDPIFGSEFSGLYEISSRDYDGIVSEIQIATTTFFDLVADRLNNDLANGYRGVIC